VEYTLTEKGIELRPVVDAVQVWADAWVGDTPGSDV
jgi:DNA-binding HxlR family transcriptional regulator